MLLRLSVIAVLLWNSFLGIEMNEPRAKVPLSKNLDWLKKYRDYFRDPHCEVCQVITLAVSKAVLKEVPAYYTAAPPPKDEPVSSAVKPARGLTDVILQGIYESNKLCMNETMNEAANRTERLFGEDLIKICPTVLENIEEGLEKHAPKFLTHREFSELVCVAPPHNYCGSVDDKPKKRKKEGKELWEADYYPQDRPLQNDRNIRLSWQFLGYNRDQPGVIELGSGVQYRRIVSSWFKPKVASPKRDGGPLCPTSRESAVTVYYVGRLYNNEEFESNMAHSEPAEYYVKELNVPGLVEGVQLMCEGDIFEFFIPPEMGFGDRGSYFRKVRSNMFLKYFLHLVEVKSLGEPKKDFVPPAKNEDDTSAPSMPPRDAALEHAAAINKQMEEAKMGEPEDDDDDNDSDDEAEPVKDADSSRKPEQAKASKADKTSSAREPSEEDDDDDDPKGEDKKDEL